MKNKPLNISVIDFFESPAILNVKNLSPVQKMILKAIRAEQLDSKTPIPITHPFQHKEFANEIEMYKYFTGKDYYEPTHYSDASLTLGRRSGKTCVLGAGLVIYYATQLDYTPYLGTSPHATIPLISPTKEQAGEVFAAIRNFFLRSPYLYQTFLNGKVSSFQEEYSEEDMKKKSAIVGGQIKLNNKVVIKVMTADVSKIRGTAIPIAVMDEACWLGVEGNDIKNTDVGISQALEPALSQFSVIEGMALVLKISSPNGQSGLMFTDYENRKDPDVLHIQVPSWYVNPTVPVKYLEKQKKKGVAFFNREYGADFVASEQSYLDPFLIDQCIIKGAECIEPLPKFRYVAAMDYATKIDTWAFSIGHKEYVLDEDKKKKEKVQIDFIIGWRGKPGEELNPDHILDEIALYMKKYRVSFCLTDQYAFAALRSLAQRKGILLKEFKTSHQSKLKYMYSLQIAINSGVLSMVHHPTAIRHLKDLREKRSNISNKLKIEAAANCGDDYADSIALVVYQFDKTSPVYIGHHYDGEVEVLNTKDAKGKHIATPTAVEVADRAGVSGFYDNRAEIEAKEDVNEEDEDEGDSFWFSI